jgi:predicted small lipoprotein YifL
MTLRRLVILAVLAGLIAACGVRGALEPPPGTADDEQKKDPDFVLDRIL